MGKYGDIIRTIIQIAIFALGLFNHSAINVVNEKVDNAAALVARKAQFQVEQR